MNNEIYYAVIGEVEYEIVIISENEVIINGHSREIDYQRLRGSSCYSLLMDGNSYEPNTYQENGGWEVLLRGKRFNVLVEDDRERRLRLASGQTALQKGKFILRSPMPGMVIDIPVQEGDQVAEGDVLVILESMKMQNELRAPKAGLITKIEAAVNDNVERKEALLILE